MYRRCWQAAALATPSLLAGCAGPQSALDPAGPSASAIAGIWWGLFWMALAVWLLVTVLLLAGLRRRRHLSEAGARRMIVAGGLVLPTVVLLGLLVHGTLASDRVTGRSADASHVVAVTGRQWHWDFVYLGDDGRPLAASTDLLAMPLGRMVEFRIESADVIHSFWIPRLGGKIDAIPGRTNVLRLQAGQAGPIRGQCAEFCGLEHAFMGFEVLVLAPGEYEAWLRDNAVARAGEGSP
ncbi:cytochrome c oxidase subunit II [Pseudoxanthomonas suwonensis]